MRGISEERLVGLINHYIKINDQECADFLAALMSCECKELTPWKPIETAPLGRILLFYPRRNRRNGSFITTGYYPSVHKIDLNEPQPTHWAAPPEDPM